jgi:DNA topoisomerase I
MELHQVDPSEPGISRARRGRAFSYSHPSGRPVRDRSTLERIKALVIPPAWTKVWICPDPLGHIQVVGRDAAGRTQYLYHPVFRERREKQKFRRLADFAVALPLLRRRVASDLQRPGLSQAKVIAAIVRLIDRSALRVGNMAYARTNGSFGATTLFNRHAKVTGETVTLSFRGKSGRPWKVALADESVAEVVAACRQTRGRMLFRYRGDDGVVRSVLAGDVNDYLKKASGARVTAKDFRTWAGTLHCAAALAERLDDPAATNPKRIVNQAIDDVAALLNNTRAVCRKSYIHPRVLKAFEQGRLVRHRKALQRPQRWSKRDLSQPEREVLALIRA